MIDLLEKPLLRSVGREETTSICAQFKTTYNA